MLKHHNGTSGYAYLYLTIFFSALLLTLLIAGLCGALGFAGINKAAGGIILASFWIIGFVITQRFVAIEKRRPTFSEANIIAIKNVLFVIILLLGLAIIGFLFTILGGGEAPEAKPSDKDEPNSRAIQIVWGITATVFLLYVAPLFNLTVLSRFMQPSTAEETH